MLLIRVVIENLITWIVWLICINGGVVKRSIVGSLISSVIDALPLTYIPLVILAWIIPYIPNPWSDNRTGRVILTSNLGSPDICNKSNQKLNEFTNKILSRETFSVISIFPIPLQSSNCLLWLGRPMGIAFHTCLIEKRINQWLQYLLQCPK